MGLDFWRWKHGARSRRRKQLRFLSSGAYQTFKSKEVYDPNLPPKPSTPIGKKRKCSCCGSEFQPTYQRRMLCERCFRGKSDRDDLDVHHKLHTD